MTGMKVYEGKEVEVVEVNGTWATVVVDGETKKVRNNQLQDVSEDTPRIRETRGSETSDRVRKKRIGIGIRRQKLSVDTRPGYVRHWFNHQWHKSPTRLSDAMESGYEIVKRSDVNADDAAPTVGDLGSAHTAHVGTNPDGSPIIGVLCEIKEEWYNEDQAEKQKECDLVDEQINRGDLSNDIPQDKRYQPSQGISMQTEIR